jgi:hypothetical protein
MLKVRQEFDSFAITDIEAEVKQKLKGNIRWIELSGDIKSRLPPAAGV